MATQLIRSCTGHGAAAGAGVAIVMCGVVGASQPLPWQSELGMGLAPSGPNPEDAAGDAVGDQQGVAGPAAGCAAGLLVVEGAVLGCAVELGLAACAIAIAGANAPKTAPRQVPFSSRSWRKCSTVHRAV
ncbi:MAG: hypothetical protein WDM87_07355 [Terracidiphilus sp.]